ncbi:helix-turn-helix domain-containing protein [Moellerella wisconsensis]|uniref:S24 family peptidase n=1 Tax=Moellerella wisconsensis TaxID=158849 RepID=UPI001F4F0F22|nr:S24 family peptidase [Moellerella wisconsensis]UNH43313.1 helix-turn-helix domain-containing protein [Moellerella wisconsensis]
MNFNDSFPRRVAAARNSLGLTQSELAKKVGVVTRQIAAYEGGEARPRINALNNLAAALGTTPEWLASGVGEAPDIAKVRSTITLPLIPVITFAQAANLTSDYDIMGYDYIPAPMIASDSAFALKIEGHSMQSDRGISFPEGSIVIFDPSLEAHHNDFVLCKLDTYSEITFKRLIKDQGELYLAPLNERYQIIPIGNNCTIIGVAIQSIYDLTKYVHENARMGTTPDWMSTISERLPDYLDEQPSLFDSPDKLIDEQKKEKPITNKKIAQRLNKIESMLEQLLSKK